MLYLYVLRILPETYGGYMKPKDLKAIRIDAGITQKEFGKILGFGAAGQVRVSELESGREPISKQVKIIASYFSKFGALS